MTNKEKSDFHASMVVKGYRSTTALGVQSRSKTYNLYS
jgi:hypothetical protein